MSLLCAYYYERNITVLECLNTEVECVNIYNPDEEIIITTYRVLRNLQYALIIVGLISSAITLFIKKKTNYVRMTALILLVIYIALLGISII